MKKYIKYLLGFALIVMVAATYRAPIVDAAINAVQQLKRDLTNGRVPVAAGNLTLANGKVLIGNSSGVGAAQTLSGDVTTNSSGVTAITAGSVVNADISATADIAFSKMENLTSTYILVGNGSNVATPVAMSGDITIDNAGATTIGAGVVETAMLQSGLAPSHVALYAGEITWTGGGATLTSVISGVVATDIIQATINSAPSEAAYLVSADVFGNNSTLFTLSAANASNDAVIAYTVFRAAP